MASEGPLSPSTTAEQGSGNAWTTPGNITASDNAYASYTRSTASGNKILAVTGFGFAIPTGATIDGILVEIEGKVDVGPDGVFVGITKNGTSSAAAKTTPEMTTTEQYQSYGGASDLWGLTWTVAEINAATFGIRWHPDEADGVVVSLDHARITVYYTPGPIALGDGSLVFTGKGLTVVPVTYLPVGDGAIAFDGKGLTLVPATPLPLGDGALEFTGQSGTGILRDAFRSAPSLRVDFYSSAGAKLDLQPLQGTDILQASYTLGVNRIGSFMLTVAADCEAAAGATAGRQVWVYRNNEGLVFKGTIMSQQITAGADGKLVMKIAGLSTGAQLLWKTTLLGKTFDNQTLSTVVTALLTSSGFSSGSIASPSTNYTGRFDAVNIWEALMRVAETFGLLLREDNLSTTIDIGAFGDVSGVIFSNVPEITPELAENEDYLPIKSIRIASESKEVWNKIIPLGHQQGIAGSDSWLTLADSDRSSPYTISSATPSGQPTYYYIGDSTSQTAYGTRERAVTFNHILPLGTSATDKLRAANALYDAAVNYLQLYKDEQVVYDVQVTNLKHLDGSAYRFQAGDKIHVEYEGMVTDEDGARTWKSVDADLFLMDFTRTFNEDGSDDWRFTLSTVDRVLQTPEMIQARAYSGVHSVQTVPLPFALFGDNVGRFSEAGLQLTSDATEDFYGIAESHKISWLQSTFAGDPIGDMWGVYGTTTSYKWGVMIRRAFKLAEGGQIFDGIWDPGTETFVASYTLLGGGSGSKKFAVEDEANEVLGLWKNGSTDDYVLRVRQGGSAANVMVQGWGLELTIASGAITVIHAWHLVDTESDAASDDLDTINGGSIGQIIVITAANSARTVVVKDGTGNLKLAGDCTLDNREDTLMLLYDGITWLELARSNNGA